MWRPPVSASVQLRDRTDQVAAGPRPKTSGDLTGGLIGQPVGTLKALVTHSYHRRCDRASFQEAATSREVVPTGFLFSSIYNGATY